MPGAPTHQAIEGAEQSQMLGDRQKCQPREHRERQPGMAQAVEENYVTSNEYDDSQRQYPMAREQASVSFHGCDFLFAIGVITRRLEPTQEQTASHQFPRHRSCESSSLPRSAGQ